MAAWTSFAEAGKGIVQHGLVVLIDFPADVAHDNPPCLTQDGSCLLHESGFRPVFVESDTLHENKRRQERAAGY